MHKLLFSLVGTVLWFSSVFVHAEETLVVTYYPYPPKIHIVDGVPLGPYIREITQIARTAGYSVKWIPTDIDSEAAMLDDGKRAFCTTGRMPNAERAKRWTFLPYLFDMVPGDTVIAHPAKAQEIRSHGNISEVARNKMFKGALLASGIYGTEIDILLLSEPHWITRTGSMDEQLVRMVLARRADWTIVPKAQWQAITYRLPETRALVEITNFGAHPDYPISIACSKSLRQETVDQLSASMAQHGYAPFTIPQ